MINFTLKLSLVLLAFAMPIAANAQAINYDTVYPFGPAETVREMSSVIPGGVNYNEYGSSGFHPIRGFFARLFGGGGDTGYHNYDDTVYGHTMQLGIGGGGTFLY